MRFVGGLMMAALLSLTACSEQEVSGADAYKIGCPAVDAAAGSAPAVRKTAASGLKQLRDSGQLDPQPTAWVDAAVEFLEADDPSKAPSATRQKLIDGCADNGFPLKNVS